MPEMDGLHFLEALRKEKPTVPVVLMTGYPSIPNAASAVRLGASDYVTKPFTPEEISRPSIACCTRTRTPSAAAVDRRRPAGRRAHPLLPRRLVSGEPRGRSCHVGTLVARPGVAKIESLRCRASAKSSTRDCRWPR